MDLLVDTLHKLKEGKHVEIPVYDFTTHARAKYTVSCWTVCCSVCTKVFGHCLPRTQCMVLMSWSLREYWHSVILASWN